MPRQKVIDLYGLLQFGPVMPNPGGPQLPFTIVGTHNDDIIKGTRGHDIINALGGDDLASGGNGNDWILGGRGDDLLDGEYGDDHLYGEEGDDYLNAGWGNDTLHGGIGNDAGWGDLGDDLIDGGAGNDSFGGAEGNDTIYGGDGDDSLEGGPGDDKIYGGAGDDLIDDMEELDGSGGHDWYYGGDGDDRLITQDIGDTLDMNIVDGGAGFDRLEMATTGTISNLGSLAGVTDGIEAIGLGYAWQATLVVNPQDVLDFSDTDTLYITGGHDFAGGGFIDCKVDSTSNGWTKVGAVQAFDNEFWHYEATVSGQQVDLYVDTWLPQAGVTA